MKIAVGLSGGVDSAVAAFLLKEQGHEVVGAIMTLWKDDYKKSVKGNACFGPDEKEDIEEVQRICDFLKIDFHQINCSEEYEKKVLSNFNNEYIAGRTPNPCVLCNNNIKFGTLPELLFASGMKFEKFATGHYVNVEYDPVSDIYLLKKGMDKKKDQSYFLYRLSQKQLSRSIFPLGGLTKKDVRKIAKKANIPVHEKPESQDFYSGDYSDLIKAKPMNGDFINLKGEKIGSHKGIWKYTIGQRKGLGISAPAPYYVIAIDAKRNQITLGSKEDLLSKGLIAEDINILVKTLPEKAKAKIRSTATEMDCSVKVSDNDMEIVFNEMQSAITPGQSVVLYENNTVLAGGIIKTSF